MGWMAGVQFMAEVGFSFAPCPDQLWGPASLLSGGYWGPFLLLSGWGMKLTTHIHLVLRLKCIELISIPSCLH